jgi:hemolysin-activating ACP:hemolysin acyltransferase
MIDSLSPDDPELDGLPPLSKDDIIVLIATFDYGKKAENPIDQARFYTKETPHKAKRVRKDQVSQMLPPTFREQQIRVFCRKDDKPSLDAAWKYFTKWCSKQKCVTPTGSGALDDTPNSAGDTTLTTSPYIAPVNPEHSRTPVNSRVVRNLF